MGVKKAFLVGINKYQGSPLNGCVNDVLLMYKILSEKLYFKTENIDIITDEQCTTENILGGLKKLTSGLSKDDIVYFHYSGHGSQVVSNDWTSGSEADGRDEILCPYDLDWKNPIRDNDLNTIFSPLIGIKSVVVLDSCHSGTGLRNCIIGNDTTVHKNRFLPPPIYNILSNPKVSIDDNLKFVFPKPTSNPQTQVRKIMCNATTQGDSILISGCMDNQTSADAFINNRYHGALTFTLAKCLSTHNFNISYKDLISAINKDIKAARFDQTPQLECKEELMSSMFLK